MADFESLLRRMGAARASDLLLAEGRPAALRVDGSIVNEPGGPIDREVLTAFMDSVLRPSHRELFDRVGDVDVGVTRPNLGRFRVHFHLQRGLLGAVVRAVPSGQLEFDLPGLPPVLKSFADAPRGLVLVVGSTGSGKSTTLAAMIHHINAPPESTSSRSKTPSSSCTKTSRAW
ncbi:MAG: ATPase, T2SS/T4P/T4SS family [Polyangiales bacterium]